MFLFSVELQIAPKCVGIVDLVTFDTRKLHHFFLEIKVLENRASPSSFTVRSVSKSHHTTSHDPSLASTKTTIQCQRSRSKMRKKFNTHFRAQCVHSKVNSVQNTNTFLVKLARSSPPKTSKERNISAWASKAGGTEGTRPLQ